MNKAHGPIYPNNINVWILMSKHIISTPQLFVGQHAIAYSEIKGAEYHK